jgi:hypothetical protein
MIKLDCYLMNHRNVFRVIPIIRWNKDNSKITELRKILQRKSQNS